MDTRLAEVDADEYVRFDCGCICRVVFDNKVSGTTTLAIMRRCDRPPLGSMSQEEALRILDDPAEEFNPVCEFMDKERRDRIAMLSGETPCTYDPLLSMVMASEFDEPRHGQTKKARRAARGDQAYFGGAST